MRLIASCVRRVSVAALAVSVLALLLQSIPAHAFAGDTLTWKDYLTISFTGPQVRQTSTLKLDRTYRTQGDESAMFVGDIYYDDYHGGYCYLFIHFFLYHASGDTTGQFISQPHDPGTSAAGAKGTIPSCDGLTIQGDTRTSQYRPSLSNQWFQIGGTRGPDPLQPETPDQMTYGFAVDAPDPKTTAPPNVTMYLYTADGSKLLLTWTANALYQDQNGQRPPDQTPVEYDSVISNLSEGDYLVCDSYVGKSCNPGNVLPGQKFHKTKYIGQQQGGATRYGSGFVSADQKQIVGHIQFIIPDVLCGASASVSPIDVQLTDSQGKTYDALTPPGQSLPGKSENGAWCHKTVTINVDTSFANMAPGIYKACATGAACVNVTKVDLLGGEFTLVIDETPQAPPDQPVCTTGDGVAGALAWVICPVTEIIAKATDFFENNIIIPFLTVSPLTTNSKNPTYIIWQDFRDAANVGFVLFLFISIFSIAFSKYGLKRVLPRLLIVAVGINLSYFAIAFVIDVFNIFGGGISQLVLAALKAAGTTQLNNGLSDGTSSSTIQNIFVLGGAALGSVLLTGGAAIGWLFSFIGLAAIVVLVVVVVLIVRQTVIILLVVLSPVAILLYMLPNTEGYFKKWRQALIKLLMMYPMIVLLFASGKIFGAVLQQPDFQFGGSGFSNDFGQAARIVLQFFAYVIPLAALPATFAASGTAMAWASGFARRRIIQPRTRQAKQRAGVLAQEAKFRSGIGKLGLRRQAVRNARASNLQNAQQDYLAEAMSRPGVIGNLRRGRAAGVAGNAGRTRAAAGAADVAARARDEDIKAERSLLTDEMRRLGLDEESFSDRTAAYLEDPNNRAKSFITGSNGQTFDFAANEERLRRAFLDSAASQGHVGAIEAARMNSSLNQTLVDDIIRRNESALKEKGGHHLTTQFNLASGRDFDMSTPAGRDAASVAMHVQRLDSMSKASENSIVSMKYGLLTNTHELLNPDVTDAGKVQHRDAVLAGMNPDARNALRDKLTSILSPRNRNTLADADVAPDVFREIRDRL